VRRAPPALLVLALAAGTAPAGCRSARPAPPPPRDWAPPASAPLLEGATVPSAAEVHRAEVEALSSPDFGARARAAEALVAAGEEALPALVAAGDAPVAVHGGLARASATRPVVEAIVATLATERLVSAHLGSPGVAVRRAAAEELGRRGTRSAWPALAGALADPDAGVREAAAAALRRATGRADVLAPRAGAEAADAAARWGAWARARAAEEAPPGGPAGTEPLGR
jgi:hypothetical protein